MLTTLGQWWRWRESDTGGGWSSRIFMHETLLLTVLQTTVTTIKFKYIYMYHVHIFYLIGFLGYLNEMMNA